MNQRRRNHYDVTDRVQVSHPGEVARAVCGLLKSLYPQQDLQPLREAYDTFTHLYAGTLPGYLGCDTRYHDAQHSLDCSLALARLIDGHERSVPAEQALGGPRAMLGVIVALFHDAGYIRSTRDTARNGAEYTLTHVRRSAQFIADFLPIIGLGRDAQRAAAIVHFTGYEMPLDQVPVSEPKDRLIGFMLGTADILAQTADRCYLEKCRDFLFEEFKIAGLAGAPREASAQAPRYRTVEALLENTPDFNRRLWEDRLDGYFGSVHRYMEHHFKGRNPYAEQIGRHLELIARLGCGRQFQKLSKRPECIDAAALRKMLGLSPRVSVAGAEPASRACGLRRTQASFAWQTSGR